MSRAAPWLLLLLLLVAAGELVYRLAGPRLAFTNRLTAPVTLSLQGLPPRAVAPGATISLRVPRGRPVVGEWTMVRPLSADRQPMGEAVQGTVLVRAMSGEVRAGAANRGPAGDYFAPLITNASSGALRVVVNAGLVGARDCGCAVRAGARRVFVGYYLLYGNSTVEARRAGRGPARFRDLGRQVRTGEGTVGLAFGDRDFPPR